jgi:hypothetical protein
VSTGTETDVLVMPQHQRCALASDPRVPAGLARLLARDPDTLVRRFLAQSTPLTEVQRVLAEDVTDVRASLATNTRLRASIQRQLAGSSGYEVLANLAVNDNLLPDLEASFASSRYVAARLSVARRRLLSPDARLRLAHDTDPHVVEELLAATSLEQALPLPAQVLESCEPGRALLEQASRTHLVDPATFGVLRVNWTGSLEELVDAARELSPAPATAPAPDLHPSRSWTFLRAPGA